MSPEPHGRDGLALLRQGRSDEEVERLTGLTLVQIVGLRAGLATGSSAALVRAPGASRRR